MSRTVASDDPQGVLRGSVHRTAPQEAVKDNDKTRTSRVVRAANSSVLHQTRLPQSREGGCCLNRTEGPKDADPPRSAPTDAEQLRGVPRSAPPVSQDGYRAAITPGHRCQQGNEGSAPLPSRMSGLAGRLTTPARSHLWAPSPSHCQTSLTSKGLPAQRGKQQSR